ncbi:MAG TPA: hypothetical protein PLN21_21965 [Gemmatales bacterium]|nr:hypothetical protein [Gemmatales bacterium]
MTRLMGLLLTTAAWCALAPETAFAQPSRNMPGTRPYLPGSPPINPSPLNPRTRAAADAVGVESTDFYGKKGYPRVLGDAVETQVTGGSAAAGNNGVSGVQAAGSSGFQGNTGNQIGQNGGGTVLGGLFGGGGGGGGGAGGGGGGFSLSGQYTGGAFTGMVPKGFGFGGTPEFGRSWTVPMNGGNGK